MESVYNENILETCRCCLQNAATLKEMWSEYRVGDNQEIYGKMLADCYSIALNEPLSHTEYICLACVRVLRKSLKFKNMVMNSEQIILQYLSEQENTFETKYERKIDEETKYELDDSIYEVPIEADEAMSQPDEKTSYTEEILSQDDSDFNPGSELDSDDSNNINDVDAPDADNDDIEYLEIEYLDDADDIATQQQDNHAGTIKTSPTKKQKETSKSKWPKKKRNVRTYKSYTSEDLFECVKAVTQNDMSQAEASTLYSIPIKTLSAKLRDAAFLKRVEDGDSAETKDAKDKHNKFIAEIKNILHYTNATLYKTKSGRYYCPYCLSGDYRHPIDEPDKLRNHIRTEHGHERIKAVERILTPYWLNEVMKIDIEDFKCVACDMSIESWNDMFEHLRGHDVDLDEAYTRLIPYKLTDDLKCALCGEKYLHYHVLDSHMNAHYNNYICGECGDTFLAEHRFKKHSETHNTGRFPCPHCSKLFTLEKYRKKHIDGVHSQEQKFKCVHCDERFRSVYLRHLHMVKDHMEKVKSITCDICFRTFDWRPYYLKHLRLQHGARDKKYKCKTCKKGFRMKYELKNHEEWHKGDDKHVCAICNKKFVSTQYLQKHYRTHAEVIEAIVIK